jgi:hypothetical protein
MSGILTYQSLARLVTRLRDDLNDADAVLLFAFNRTGKTRLSIEFKDAGKRGTRRRPGVADTLYFNALTEDLFVWDNDLENDRDRRLLVNAQSSFVAGFRDLALAEVIAAHFGRYCTAKFDVVRYSAEEVAAIADPSSPSHVLYRRFGNELEATPKYFWFRHPEFADPIKISRGEERLFVWSVFLSIFEQVLSGEQAYRWVKYIYIDDPISSLDDNNAIAVACDLAKLLRRAATRKDANGAAAPIKVVFSSHHALFFNVMCNEINNKLDGGPTVRAKRYFLHRSTGSRAYSLKATEHTPFFHHVATLAELRLAADPRRGKLYTYHFNALRSIMEKTGSFLGQERPLAFCLKALDNEEDRALFNRALNLLSHGAYAIHEPTEMGEDNKELFRRILREFIARFEFALPGVVAAQPAIPAPAPAAEEAPAQ